MFTKLALLHRAYLKCVVDGDIAHCTSCTIIIGRRLAKVVRLMLVVVQYYVVSTLCKICAVGNSGGIHDWIWTWSLAFIGQFISHPTMDCLWHFNIFFLNYSADRLCVIGLLQ